MFLAKDVAEWIDYCKTGNGSYDVSSMTRCALENEKIVLSLPIGFADSEKDSLLFGNGRPNAKTNFTFLTEWGLYRVLMRSDKPLAQEFQTKVCEILTTIRKTGGFIAE